MAAATSLPLLRLLQVTDSSFPVGGYAYSHGLEWMVHASRVAAESDLATLLNAFVAQVVRRQWLPAAAAGYRAASVAQVVRIDVRIDASIIAVAERDAGRAMGRRLLGLSTATMPSVPRSRELRESVVAGAAPGQFAVAFAVLARDCGVGERDMLAALGYSAVTSMTQAAVRLGVIGPEAAVRLVSDSATALAAAADEVAAATRQRIGAFVPALELASMLQPTLGFRMFAS